MINADVLGIIIEEPVQLKYLKKMPFRILPSFCSRMLIANPQRASSIRPPRGECRVDLGLKLDQIVPSDEDK
jgi:hypothetical protein